MTTEQALQKIESTWKVSFELFPEDTTWPPVIATRHQLEYLKSVLDNTSDRSQLKDINIGLIAVREFENDHEDFAKLIYEVVAIVQLLKNNRL